MNNLPGGSRIFQSLEKFFLYLHFQVDFTLLKQVGGNQITE